LTRFPADLQAAALVDETVAFELNAAAAHFDRQGHAGVAQALREQADTLCAEASRLQAEADALPQRQPVNERPIVLVVEDEPGLLEVVTSGLEDAGCRVLQAPDYEIADLLLRSAAAVDLLLTDLRLPDRFTGWDVAERGRSRFPDLPVIYATGYSVEEPRPVSRSLLMRKPYRPSAVIKAMQQLGVTYQS